MRLMRFITVAVAALVTISLPGCGRKDDVPPGVPEAGFDPAQKISNTEVERRLRDYSVHLDSVANFAELLDGISLGLGIEIVVEAENVAPDTPVNLKNSKESFVIQILEHVCTATQTRMEVRKGKLYIQDAW